VSPPVRSSAFTSKCDASHGAISAGEPVSTLTTPPGTSLVASTSASEMADSGCLSSATTTTTLPVTIAGATTATSPSSEDPPCGAMAATTPVGSGTEMLKYGPATGFALPVTCAYLSAQPA